VEQAHLDVGAQPLVRAGDRGQSAARGLGPPPEAELHHPDQGAPAELCAVLLPRGRGARILFALSFDLPGAPIRITLREKANPFAHKRKRPS
jgi:hypothetical protein